MAIWDALLELFRDGLTALHGVFASIPFISDLNAWGWAIIGVTIVVRLLLLPLAIKQTRSMRGMQALQPKIKEIQKKHKVDRSMMRSDPKKYKQRKEKMNQEMMALYKEAGVNPAAGCLPLLAQAPIFFALFRVLSDFEDVKNGAFYFFTGGTDPGLGGSVSAVGFFGWTLVVLMAGSMFWSQRQMSGRTAGDQAQQQKIIMYAMPVFLGVIAVNLPVGVLLYWVTTNVWQMGQQAWIFRDVQPDEGSGDGGRAGAGPSGDGSGNGRKRRRRPDTSSKRDGAPGSGKRRGTRNQGKGKGNGNGGGKRRDGGGHLPKRRKDT